MISSLKKSIGSKRAAVGLCAVLVAVSAFFYAPMDVSASGDFNSSGTITTQFYAEHFVTIQKPVGIYVFDSNAIDDLYYDVDLDLKLTFDTVLYPKILNVLLGAYHNSDYIPVVFFRASDNGGVWAQHQEFTYSGSVVLKGSLLKNLDLSVFADIFGGSTETFSLDYSLDIDVNSITPLSGTDSEQYENGYNAGYSAGEQAGYGNGYSQGFTDGEASVDTDAIYDEAFQAGKDSVDTQSYYDAGYQAGYQVAFQEGYESGYDEGLKSARESKGEWGVQKKLEGDGETLSGIPFYVSTYGITDLEISDNDAFYFYNTSPGTYHGKSEILYKMPVSSMNSPYGALVSDSGVTNVSFVLPSLNLDIAVDSAGGTVSSNMISYSLVECFVTYAGKKYYGVIGSNYVNFDFVIDEPVDQLLFSDSNFLITFVVDSSVVVVTKSDVSEYVVPKYTPKISFSDFNFFIKPYYMNDNVSANIQAQTDKITGSLDEQKEIQQGQLEEQKEQTETQKGIAASIKEFFGSFFDNLINSIIHVIVPTKEEMGELFNRLNDFFSETFGFLYYPFEFIINAFNIFLVADSGTGLTLPAFSIMGYEVWGNQTYDIASEPIVGEIFGFVRMGTGAMLVMWFVNFLKDFFDKRFGGGGN